MNTLPIPTDDFLARARELKASIAARYKAISETETPKIDDQGNKLVDSFGGHDYIKGRYMERKLDELFPGWSWEMAAPLQFLGSEWVVAQGHLIIIDEDLLAFGIVPPVRRYYGVSAARIAYGKDKPHTPDNIVDIGHNCIAANTEAKKVAINRLCHIGDDIYGRRIYGNGYESLEAAILDTGGDKSLFTKYVNEKRLLWSNVMSIEGMAKAIDNGNYTKALELIKGGDARQDK